MLATVAVLEDQPVVRESLVQLLETAGMQVLFHGSAPDEFLAKVKGTPPQVAVVDLRLEGEDGPISSGLSVVRAIKLQDPSVALLVLSAADDAASVERCYREGAGAFLSKQRVSAQMLLDTVTAMCAAGSNPSDSVPTGAEPRPVQSAGDGHAERMRSLTPREAQVLSYVSGGSDNLKISACLEICERTVKAHITSLYRKLNVENRTQMALVGRELGFKPPKNA